MTSFNLNGSKYDGICSLNSSNNDYLVVFDGNKVDFLRKTPQGNYFANNGGAFYPIALTDSKYLNLVAEDMILNKIMANLTNICKEMGLSATNYIVNYTSYLEGELKNMSSKIVVNDDPSKSLEEREKAFREMCDSVASSLEHSVEAKIKINNVESTKKENDIEASSKAFSTSIEVQTDNSNITIEDLISKLDASELEKMKEETMKDSNANSLDIVKKILSERVEVKELLDQGYTLDAAIKSAVIEEKVDLRKDIQMEQNKVKMLRLNSTLNKPLTNREAAFVNFITLSLISTLTVFLTVMATLQLIK